MTIDLDELERLEKAATKGPWHDASGKGSAVVSAPGENCAVYLNVRAVELDETVARWQADAALIVALRNEAVPMIQELRELRASRVPPEREELLLAAMDAATARAERDALRAEVDELRAQLATAREAIQATVDLLESSRKAHSKGSPEYDALFIRCEVGGALKDALKKTTKGGGA